MAVSAGTRLGPYEILAPLGAGGMGEVYRASDTRLKRQVAIKILPPLVAADPERLARFQREAEVLASLNHPHIAAIYGSEESPSTGSGQAGVKALVMELVEGPTLADRIAQGPIPFDEALPIARQIAAALEAAHERGIIHRDLKPANIKVREDGTVKVLDFGLAKLVQPDAVSAGDLSQSPTLTSPALMTGMGMILGTAAYMSPEQARGRAVDKRTDVWAFGAVLYEMLSGRRAFDGEDVTDVMAAVVKSAPDWTALPPDVPPHVVALIQRCLEKDRNERIGDIAVARFLLAGHAPQGPSSGAAVVTRTAAGGWRRMAPWLLAALVAGAALGWLLAWRPAGAIPVVHLQMSVAPADQLIGSAGSVRPARTALAISPDGRFVVFDGARGPGSQLYIRALDRPEATPIAGTEAALGPFFSPDGAWLGFWAGDAIKKVPPAGGVAVVVCATPPGRRWGASWGEDGTIFFAAGDGVFKVPSAGGTPAPVTTVDGSRNERHLLPQPLPGGKALLFTGVTGEDWETANIILQPLPGGEQRILIAGGVDARYVDTGHIVYLKNATLMAVPFDVGSLKVTGAPVALIADVMQAVNAPNSANESGSGQFVVSSSGTLLYALGGITPARQQALVWVDRKGAEQPLPAAPGPYFSPRLSPDGRRVAVTVRRGASRATDLWVYDVSRGAPTRLTFDGSNTSAWSPDGKRLVYGSGSLYAVNADGGGKPERIATSEYNQIPSSWSSRGNAIAFLQRVGPVGAVRERSLQDNGIWVLPMDGPPEGRRPRLFLQSRFNVTAPDFSPDGHWIAYVSNESGASEVYVQPYPGPGEKTRISTNFGIEPIWTAGGREILYRTYTRTHLQVLSVAVRSFSPFQIDAPRLLFEAPLGVYDTTGPTRGWDATPDGLRFLMAKPITPTDKPVTAIQVVLNWTEELKRLVR